MDGIHPTGGFIEGQQARSLTRSSSMASGIERGKYKLLLVDDHPSILKKIGGAHSDQGYCVKTSSSAEAAVEAMNTEDYDLVINDLNVSRRDEMDIGETLTEILLDILPQEIRKSGRGREYFEVRMLRNWFPDLTEDEKVLVISLTKAVLDRSFPT